MNAKHVTKNEDLSTTLNGTFVFCKELDKGFIKRDLSLFSGTTFEEILIELEGLDLVSLTNKQTDVLSFGDELDEENRGLILVSKKRTMNIDLALKTLPSYVLSNGVDAYLNIERSHSRYFNFDGDVLIEGRDITLSGNDSVEGYTVTVYGPGGKMAETEVDANGDWTVTIENTTVGRFQLSIVITKPDGEVAESFETIVDVLDPDIEVSPEEEIYVADPIKLSVEPFEQVTLFDTAGNVVGMGTANADGNVSITPVGVGANATSVSVAVGGAAPYSTAISNTSPASVPSSSNSPSLTPVAPATSVSANIVVADLEYENGFPYIQGVTSPCGLVVVELADGTYMGFGKADSNGNYKAMVTFLPEGDDFDIFIKTFPRDCVEFGLPDLPEADTVSALGGGQIGSFSFGHFWVGATVVAGAKHYSTTSNDIYVIETSQGNRIVYSGFRDNPWTKKTNYGPDIFYIDGENLYEANHILNRTLELLNGQYTIDYTWNTNQKSFKITTATEVKIYRASEGWQLSDFI